MKKFLSSVFYKTTGSQAFPEISSSESEKALAKWKLCKTKDEKLKWHLKYTPWFPPSAVEALIKYEMNPDERYIETLPKLSEIVLEEIDNEKKSKTYYHFKFEEEKKADDPIEKETPGAPEETNKDS